MFDVEPMIIKDITYQNYVNYESTDIATPHNIIICIFLLSKILMYQ